MAPPPSKRYPQFLDPDYPRKIVTIEPVMDFDLDIFAAWLVAIAPALVYLGFNSRPKPKLPEPTPDKLVEFAKLVSAAGIPIVGKALGGLKVMGVICDSKLVVEAGGGQAPASQVAASCLAAPKSDPTFE